MDTMGSPPQSVLDRIRTPEPETSDRCLNIAQALHHPTVACLLPIALQEDSTLTLSATDDPRAQLLESIENATRFVPKYTDWLIFLSLFESFSEPLLHSLQIESEITTLDAAELIADIDQAGFIQTLQVQGFTVHRVIPRILVPVRVLLICQNPQYYQCLMNTAAQRCLEVHKDEVAQTVVLGAQGNPYTFSPYAELASRHRAEASATQQFLLRVRAERWDPDVRTKAARIVARLPQSSPIGLAEDNNEEVELPWWARQ